MSLAVRSAGAPNRKSPYISTSQNLMIIKHKYTYIAYKYCRIFMKAELDCTNLNGCG